MTHTYVDGSDYSETGFVSQKPSVVFVHSMDCVHCVAAKPIYEEFCKLYGQQYDCFWCDVNDQRGRDFLFKLGHVVRGVPAFLKFSQGKLLKDATLLDRSVSGLVQFMA